MFVRSISRQLDAYWSGRPGVLAVDCCRIALALVYVLMNFRHPLVSASAIRSAYPASNYTPDGILMLLGGAMPSDGVIDAVILLSKVFPVLLLAGLFSRASLIGTLLTHLFLRTLIESFSTNWSHGLNVVFLAHLGFLFAPVGQRLSLDAWIRSVRGLAARPQQNGFWAVVCAQWCVAIMFFSAFYWKALYNVRPPFAWAHWENMRNQLLYRYEWSGDPVPEFLRPVLDSPFLCGALAWGNLIFQLMPIVSVFFLHRPALRLLLGLGFVVEELGLAVVMGLADLHWLPLIAFFVDWDHFAAKLGANAPSGIPSTALNRWKKVYAYGLITVYLLFSLNVSGVAFGHNVFDLRAYPFSQFSMYSSYLRSQKPGVLAYPGTTFRIEESALSPEEKQQVERILKRRFYGAHAATPEEAHGILTMALQWANNSERTGLSGRKVEQLAMFCTLHMFRTDTAHLANGPSGLIGRTGPAGSCTVSARFTQSIPDTASVILRDECGPYGNVTSVWVAGSTGSLNTVPFNATGTEIRLSANAIEGEQYLYITRSDSAGSGQDALLLRIVFED